MKVSFSEYYNTFFAWAGNYKIADRKTKTQARKGYKEYCSHINQKELIWN